MITSGDRIAGHVRNFLMAPRQGRSEAVRGKSRIGRLAAGQVERVHYGCADFSGGTDPTFAEYALNTPASAATGEVAGWSIAPHSRKCGCGRISQWFYPAFCKVPCFTTKYFDRAIHSRLVPSHALLPSSVAKW